MHMTLKDYDPKTVEASYHHSWSIIQPQNQGKSLENNVDYGIRLINAKEDYSEVPKVKYSDGHPEISEYFLG